MKVEQDAHGNSESIYSASNNYRVLSPVAERYHWVATDDIKIGLGGVTDCSMLNGTLYHFLLITSHINPRYEEEWAHMVLWRQSFNARHSLGRSISHLASPSPSPCDRWDRECFALRDLLHSRIVVPSTKKQNNTSTAAATLHFIN